LGAVEEEMQVNLNNILQGSLILVVILVISIMIIWLVIRNRSSRMMKDSVDEYELQLREDEQLSKPGRRRKKAMRMM
jgi:hypothetical protein